MAKTLILRRQLKQLEPEPSKAPSSWFEGWNVGNAGRRPVSPYERDSSDDDYFWVGYYVGVEDRNTRCGYINEEPTTHTRLRFRDVYIGETFTTSYRGAFEYRKIAPATASVVNRVSGQTYSYTFDADAVVWIEGPVSVTTAKRG